MTRRIGARGEVLANVDVSAGAEEALGLVQRGGEGREGLCGRGEARCRGSAVVVAVVVVVAVTAAGGWASLRADAELRGRGVVVFETDEPELPSVVL